MSIVYQYRLLTSPAFQPCKYFCSTARKSILLSELKVKMLLFFAYNYFILSIIFLEDKHNILLHLSIFYEYQQFFQHRICFSIQPPDYSDPWPTLTRSSSFFWTKYLRFLCKFTSWSGETPTGNISDVFFYLGQE
jgi:hypothetical protein